MIRSHGPDSFAIEGIRNAEKRFNKPHKSINFIILEPDRNVKLTADQTIRAIEQYKPIAMIGAVTSNSALIIGDIAQRYSIPFITPFATHPNVTKDKSFVFRTCFDDSYQAEKLAEFVAKDLNKKRIAVLINMTNAYSVGIKEIFEKKAITYGASIVLSDSFNSEKDFTPERIEAIRQTKPDAVLLPSYQVEAASILAILSKVLPKETVYIGPDSWGGGPLFRNMFNGSGDSFKGYYVRQVREDRIPKDWNEPRLIGFDLGRTLFEAITIQQKNGGPLRDAIEKVDFQGLTGRIAFNKNHTAEKPLFIHLIDKIWRIFF